MMRRTIGLLLLLASAAMTRPVLAVLPAIQTTMAWNFDRDSATLKEPERKGLEDFFLTDWGQSVSHDPARAKEPICVEGHTDKSEAHPIDLSLRRAREVAQYLVELGLPRERIRIDGLGATRPLYVKQEEDWQNRFVEVKFFNAQCRPEAVPLGDVQ